MLSATYMSKRAQTPGVVSIESLTYVEFRLPGVPA